MKKFDLLISILTLPEVNFLAPVAKKLIESGNSVGFILFHEAGSQILDKLGIPHFSVFEVVEEMNLPEPGFREIEECRKEFAIPNFTNLYIHEKIGYGRTDEHEQAVKVFKYLKALDYIINKTGANCVLQELGGYTPNHAVFHAARKNGVDHVFYEPAPFKNRIVFNINSYFCNFPEDINRLTPPEETKKIVQAYINDYFSSHSVMVPFKDRLLFRDQSIGRIFNLENARKLKRKLWHKYIEGKREEYSEIGYVVRHAFRSYLRRILLSIYYEKNPDYDSRYIYFPFHFPYDVSISSRSRLFYFQEGFVEYLCRTIPHGYKLFIKEHPLYIGGHSFTILRKLLLRHGNLSLIHPLTNSFEIIKNAAAIVTVNSKLGFESIMQGKKVVVVGDSFYKGKGVTFDCDNINVLGETLNNALDSEPPPKERVIEFLARTWEWSYPSEMFYLEKENMKSSYSSFHSYLKKIGKIN